ncbi:histidinol-phosphate transaminase [Butyricimonas sp. NSJ-56]|uniref:Histidinol-phosphate aminotransferase n=2 Tax=Butyricimonas hominis TaxID=2763032 RepID=A0ABR7D1N0_9BACT|nr:histidinol-phosphate transaminase [Butyricimonas hominis]
MEMEFENLVRENIRELEAYSCARGEFEGAGAVLLDANENPFASGYNRYPDPYQRELKQQVARLKEVDVSRLVLGNGSDELIDMLIRTVCVPGRDNIIVFSPGYSMYEVSARVNGTEVRNLVLDDDFMPEWEGIFERVDERTRIIFFCTPNNPVGNVIPLDEIRRVASRFDGLVVVDEAYIDFADVPSATSLRGECPNVVVLQTLSKAWGLAGLRVGICMAEPGLVKYLNKVKPPYNIGSVTQRMALEALKNVDLFRERVEEIKQERERVLVALRGMACFERVYDSEANFLLACTPCYREVYDYLLAHGLVVRVRHIPPRLEGGLRITIGTREENDLLIRVLKDFR